MAPRIPGLMWSAMTLEEEAEALAMLDAVGATLTATSEEWAWAGSGDNVLQQTGAGDIAWRLSNGWRVVVFNDCGDWDYIDRIEAPDGRWWEYPDGETDRPMSRRMAEWRPETRAARKAWLDQQLPTRDPSEPAWYEQLAAALVETHR